MPRTVNQSLYDGTEEHNGNQNNSHYPVGEVEVFPDRDKVEGNKDADELADVDGRVDVPRSVDESQTERSCHNTYQGIDNFVVVFAHDVKSVAHNRYALIDTV